MLSNAYFLAKFRFDTADNEPAKNLQNFAKFANFADPNPLLSRAGGWTDCRRSFSSDVVGVRPPAPAPPAEVPGSNYKTLGM